MSTVTLTDTTKTDKGPDTKGKGKEIVDKHIDIVGMGDTSENDDDMYVNDVQT